MNFQKAFKDIQKEWDKEIATLTIVALTLNLSLKPKSKDITNPGRYTIRLNKKTHDILWEYDEEVVDLIIKIRDAWRVYENYQAFNGLGGNKKKTLKEIIKDIEENA